MLMQIRVTKPIKVGFNILARTFSFELIDSQNGGTAS